MVFVLERNDVCLRQMMSASPNDLGKHHITVDDASLKNPTFYDIILPEERCFFAITKHRDQSNENHF